MPKQEQPLQNRRAVKKMNNVVPTARFNLFKVKLLEAKNKKDPIKAILKLCVEESKDLRKQFESLTTLRRYYTFYRNICRDVLDQKTLAMCLEILNLTKKEIDDLNEQYEKKVAREHQKDRKSVV